MIKLIYSIKDDLDSNIKKSLINAMQEELDEIDYYEKINTQVKEDTKNTHVFKIFDNLIEQSGINDVMNTITLKI